MELRTLKYFLAVAKEENMTSAASALHISQPALSYQITQLEEELGVLLFIRSGRKIRLSEDGLRFLSRAEEIVSLSDRTLNEFQNNDSDLYGEVHIGAAETKAMHMVAEVIKDITSEHPHISFHFTSGNIDDVYEKLSRGLLDFAFMLEPVNVVNCEIIPIPVKNRMGLVVRKEHLLAGKEIVTAEDLYDLPLFLPSRSNMNIKDYARILDIPENRLNVVGTGNLIHNMSIMAEHGIGCVFTMEGLVGEESDPAVRFIPFSPAIERGFAVVYKQYRPLSKAAELFLKKMLERIAEEKDR